ncbi:MAG TPA: type II toxin-antitoxin system RelE/ParE family toxin [Candidatus Acidoferrales bacterium]|nr:type II toxin-antitoxin system RelE/ParE family toxin [Candidatus Acidoferrales bacterium]
MLDKREVARYDVAYELQRAEGHVETRERNVRYYLHRAGPPAPFSKWRDSLSDIRTRAAIDARIARLRLGNFSDAKRVGGGVSEARINYGPGYRIYFAVDGDDVILLCGGDKSSQGSDIETAKGRWRDYQERTRHERNKLSGRSTRRPAE